MSVAEGLSPAVEVLEREPQTDSLVSATPMGGSVGVESDEGQGSRFWLELSAAPAPLAGMSLPSAALRTPL
jgi:hypothetical protein